MYYICFSTKNVQEKTNAGAFQILLIKCSTVFKFINSELLFLNIFSNSLIIKNSLACKIRDLLSDILYGVILISQFDFKSTFYTLEKRKFYSFSRVDLRPVILTI